MFCELTKVVSRSIRKLNYGCKCTHKLNENVDVAELDQLSDIYQSILANLLT